MEHGEENGSCALERFRLPPRTIVSAAQGVLGPVLDKKL